MYNAVGAHVFAGGFTLGVQASGFNVKQHMESHGFGLETATSMCNVECINDARADAVWPVQKNTQFVYGNPRCTGFSAITHGCGEESHGPWAKQTRDIHELCRFGVKCKADVVCWESVQQAYTTGKPMIDYLIAEYFAPHGYRVAHLMMNAGSFGNSQRRRRYFFLAYKDDRNFNIEPPELGQYSPVVYDAIWDERHRETRAEKICSRNCDYDADCYRYLSPCEAHAVAQLPTGWNLNTLGKYAPERLSPKLRELWETRVSDIPFSLHAPSRLAWKAPSATLTSACVSLIHPGLDRPITVREASLIMGWPKDTVPRGPYPFAQIAKGVVPSAAQWLAEQVKLYLNGSWGSDDWESSYDEKKGEWVGKSVNGAREKFFDLTQYVQRFQDDERFEVTDAELQRYRFVVGRRAG